MTSLIEKWGSKDCWRRSLYCRTAVMWLFREELRERETSRLLESILKDAYLSIDIQAKRCANNRDTFDRSIELIRNNIDQRIAQAGDDPDLIRLREIADGAHPSDSIRKIFSYLLRNTRNVYYRASPRKVQLKIEWLNDHPLHSMRPGDFPDQYHVDARTEVKPDISVVELQVFLDQYDAPSLLAMPALLTHELVCHAYAAEDRNNQWSIWAEGVMDWVADFFFAHWSPYLDLPYTLVKKHGNGLQSARFHTARYGGRAAADALAQWLVSDTAVSDIDMASQVIVKLALELNVTNAPLLAKDELASRLAKIRKEKPLQQAFRSWWAGDLPPEALLP